VPRAITDARRVVHRISRGRLAIYGQFAELTGFPRGSPVLC
jgi:alkylated DNA nucleotide flippase Atl1